ncbi:MAG: glycosyltransferase family 9 protein [Deltaproteobacteria bacterium]
MERKEGISWLRVLTSTGSAKVRALKLADHLIGPLVKRRRRVPLGPAPIRRMLVIRPGGLGDAILVIPLLRALREAFPSASLDVVAEQRNASAFGLVRGEISDLILYDRPPFLRFLAEEERAYDLTVDTEQWHWFSAFVAARLSAGPCVGFDTRPRRSRFYTIAVPYSMQRYEAENFLELLQHLQPQRGLVFPGPGFLSIPEVHLAHAQQETGERAAVLFISASIRERYWPFGHWRELIKQMVSLGFRVVLVGGRQDHQLAVDLAAGFTGYALPRTGTSLADTAALIAASQVFIGADSGILHLAYALGRPTISFFGPGIESKWAPRGADHVVLNKHLPCSPCTLFGYTPRCDNVYCMKHISPSDVLDALRLVLPQSL